MTLSIDLSYLTFGKPSFGLAILNLARREPFEKSDNVIKFTYVRMILEISLDQGSLHKQTGGVFVIVVAR